MKQLPNDILSEIFLHLHESDRTECVGVCHHWKRVLEDTALYQTVTLLTIDSLRKLLVKIQDEPDIAKKIQNLYILFKDKNAHQIEVNQLLLLLPNIRFLFCTSIPHNDSDFQKAEQYSWYESVEYFEDRGGQKSLILPTLSTSTFINLSTLIIYLDKDREIVSLLKNTPALENLTLLSGVIALNDLDTLHKSVPCLKSLTLKNTKIDSISIGSNVSPAVSISRFRVGYLYMSSAAQGTNLLVYISKKYPNLSELSINAEYDYTESDFDDQLEHLNTNGWNYAVRNIGPQLRKLSINVESGILNFFEKLDESKLQINHLCLIYGHSETMVELIQSQQIQCINTLSVSYGDVGKSFKWLNKFTVLKDLKLRCSIFYPVNMKDILINSPPTLRSLTLSRYHIYVDSEYHGEYQLTYLALIDVTVREKIDTFINQHFPNLSKLILKRYKSEKIIWDLPALNLSLFQFNPESLMEYYKVLIKTYNSNESRLYSVRNIGTDIVLPEGHPLKRRSFRSYPSIETNVTLFFTLNCNSLKNISFDL